jgi:hypothetical protein
MKSTLFDDVREYESWLRTQCSIVERALAAKHELMKESPFAFLRATYFRWAKTISDTCPGFEKAPAALCIGDAHVENFGTWRDADGRHVWGLNDFDEAAVMPYPYDLIRLATSAYLVPKSMIRPSFAARAVLRGYLDGLRHPRPVLLDEGASWFRKLNVRLTADTKAFWADVAHYKTAQPPSNVRRLLLGSLPREAKTQRFVKRRKGAGSLGRPRFLAIADWNGGQIVREAKALVPSAWEWAGGTASGKPPPIVKLAFGSFRAPDPSLTVRDLYLIRRVASDSHKLDLEQVADQGLSESLLAAMGTEIGSVHAAGGHAKAIQRHVRKLNPKWLQQAVVKAAESVEIDHRAWRSGQRR